MKITLRAAVSGGAARMLTLGFAIALGTIAGPLPADAQTAAANRVFGGGKPIAVQDLPSSRLRQDLERLTPTARGRALAELGGLSFPAADANSLRVDREGSPFYSCSFGGTGGDDGVGSGSDSLYGDGSMPTEDTEGVVDLSTVFRLHSRPEATRVVYINFSGFLITGTKWNQTAGVDPLDAMPRRGLRHVLG
jgi:hypothetical protein